MKSIKFLLTAVLISSMSLTSCSNDDDDNSNSTGGELQRRWTPTKTIVEVGNQDLESDYTGNQAGCDKDYIEFAAANVFNKVEYNNDVNGNGCVAAFAIPATYSRNDNTLVISSGTYAGTYTITRLTNSELRISKTDNAGSTSTTTRHYFDRVNTSN